MACKRRVELARALAMRPKILLLDEPMAGMNLEETEDMARFILDVNEEWGVTVVLIEHDMGVVMDISDNVVVLDFGTKIAQGSSARGEQEPPRHRGLSRGRGRGPFQAGFVRRKPGEAPSGPEDLSASRNQRRGHRQRDTMPSPACKRNARTSTATPRWRFSEKEYGIWQSVHLASISTSTSSTSPWAWPPWALADDDALAIIGDNRPGVGLCRAGHPEPEGAPPGHLPRLHPQRGGLRHRPLPGPSSWWPRTRSRPTRSWTCKHELPQVKKVIYTDPKGMRDYDDPLLIYFCPTWRSWAASFEKDNPGYYEKVGGAPDPGGHRPGGLHLGLTTGFPKGSLLTHSNMLKMALNLAQVDPKFARTTSSSPSCPCPGSGSR